MKTKDRHSHKYGKTKGQSALVSHAVLVGFSVFFIFIVVTTFANLNADFREFILENELQQACLVIKGGVENVYSQSDYRPYTETVHGSITVNLPERIAGENYNVRFENKSVLIEAGQFSYSCKVGLNIDYSGSSSGGATTIKFTRNLTTDRIEMART